VVVVAGCARGRFRAVPVGSGRRHGWRKASGASVDSLLLISGREEGILSNTLYVSWEDTYNV
jgi:hypothetical protein